MMEGDAPGPAFSADIDALLNPSERAQRTAWIAHIESALGDLVVRCPLPEPIPFCSDVGSSQAHAFYTVPANYAAVTQPTLSSFYSAPQTYYVPSRIRKSYQTRLEATGLCTAPAEEPEVETPKPKRFGEEEKQKDDPKQTFKMAFQRERVGHSNTMDILSAARLIWSQQVLEKSRAAFDLYVRLLGDKNFFFYDRCAMGMRCARSPDLD
jgi:sorting and assembly machinery component 37